MTREYKSVVLDESILDSDSWLPQSAIDEVVKEIINYENKLEERKFLVQIKGFEKDYNFLNYCISNDLWIIQSDTNLTNYRTHHSYKELEDAGFGWVFNSDGVIITEV